MLDVPIRAQGVKSDRKVTGIRGLKEHEVIIAVGLKATWENA